jgi:hypothetical protein
VVLSGTLRYGTLNRSIPSEIELVCPGLCPTRAQVDSPAGVLLLIVIGTPPGYGVLDELDSPGPHIFKFPRCAVLGHSVSGATVPAVHNMKLCLLHRIPYHSIGLREIGAMSLQHPKPKKGPSYCNLTRVHMPYGRVAVGDDTRPGH